MEEIYSRVPKNWTWKEQNDGKGIKFVDQNGDEKLRIHQADENAPVGSNSNSGWVERVPADKKGKKYYDNDGNIGGRKANETHIPIYGNPNASKKSGDK